MANWWDVIIGGVVKPVADVFIRREERKAMERQLESQEIIAIHERKIELIKAGLAADATWELEQIKNSGWKDEWVLIVLSIPLVMCFIPWLAPFVLAGFEVLDKTPNWYQWLIGVIFTAIYGIRLYRKQQYDTP